MQKQLILLEGLLHEYDALSHLECDGFCRVATYVLKTNGVPCIVYQGRCEVGDKVVEPHFWIQSGKYTVDYRLRVWAGESAPHGVFEREHYSHVRYDGEPVDMTVSTVQFQILSGIR